MPRKRVRKRGDLPTKIEPEEEKENVKGSKRKRLSKKEPKEEISLTEKKRLEFQALVSAQPETAAHIASNLVTVGAHISCAKGCYNALINAYKIGASAFAFFPTPPRKWPVADRVYSEDDVAIFREGMQILGYRPENIVPHGNYLVNLGSPVEATYNKSYTTFVNELKLCEQLSIPWLNIHPGSAVQGCGRDECMKRIADAINKAHKQTSFVTVLLENMCKQGSTIGGDLAELATIISHVTDKSRVGVLLDTCHAMAAGYDLSEETGFEAMIKELDFVLGLHYLKAFHVNDKKGPCGDHLDRHECLGKGTLGMGVFRSLVCRFPTLPLIVETPQDHIWPAEVALLRNFAPKVDRHRS